MTSEQQHRIHDDTPWLAPGVLDLRVTIPSAGWLISGYALGVAIGAPVMTLLTARLPRKRTLILLMAIFIIGNLLCALAWSYNLLMLARIVTALCHGAFFGIGAVVAASLVAPNRQASAVALMFTGLTLANVLGVPLGTWFGQLFGWRATFWGVAVIGVLAFVALLVSLPTNKEEKPVHLASEISALANGKLWLSLLMTVCFAAAMFTLFSYIAPLLLQGNRHQQSRRQLDAVPDWRGPDGRQHYRRQAGGLESLLQPDPELCADGDLLAGV